MTVSSTIQKLVLHWGEMGARWGINRTIAQVHALLFFSPEPLPADAIVQALGVARSNVSHSLRELQSWGVVRVVHRLGDRRDHFTSLQDVWEMFEKVLDQRKQREVDPTLRALRETAHELDRGRLSATDRHTRARLGELLEFFETTDAWYEEVRRLPRELRIKLLRLGPRLRRLLDPRPRRRSANRNPKGNAR